MKAVVFLDTVALLALWNRHDQWHDAAMQARAGLKPPATRLVTTPAVLQECGNAAARSAEARRQVVLTRAGLAAAGDLIVPTDEDEDLAWAAYERGEAGGAGIVDHISFVVMRRLGLARAFTNDRHFTAAGFEVLF